MTVLEVTRNIFRQIGRIPFDYEDVGEDVSMIGSVSGSFSLPNITSRIEDAQKDIASKVKASHISTLIDSYTDGTYSGGNLYTPSDILRVLPDRVFYNSNRCRRITADRQKILEKSGRSPSNSYPVYVLEDGYLEVFPSNGHQAKFYYVETPNALSSPTDSAWNSFPGSDNSDSLQIPDRFQMAVVAHVCSSLGESLESPGISEIYENVYNTEISVYKRGVSGSSFNDREVDIE